MEHSRETNMVMNGSDTRPPMLMRGEYSQWKSRFLKFIRNLDNGVHIRTSIDNGPCVFYIQPAAGAPEGIPLVQKPESQYNDAEKLRLKADYQAETYILQALPNEIYRQFDSLSNAKAVWDEIQKMFEGSEVGAEIQQETSLNNYEKFKSERRESIYSAYTRFCGLLNELRRNNILKGKLEINLKFVNNLPVEWENKVHVLRETKKLHEIDIHQVYESLSKYSKSKEIMEEPESSALIASLNPVLEYSDEEEDGGDMAKFQESLALVARMFQKKKFFNNKTNNNLRTSSRGASSAEPRFKNVDDKEKKTDVQVRPSKANMACRKCGELGHFVRECTAKVVKGPEYYRKKMDLANQRVAGKALMAEDDHWLDLESTDEEEEINLCYMAHCNESSSTSATQVSSLESSEYELNSLKQELNLIKEHLKDEQNLSKTLDKQIKDNHQEYINMHSMYLCAHANEKMCKKELLNIKNTKDLSTKTISDLTSDLAIATHHNKCYLDMHKASEREKAEHLAKIKSLEDLQWRRGQTHQTVNLMTPKDTKFYNAKAGLGSEFPSPKYLERAFVDNDYNNTPLYRLEYTTYLASIGKQFLRASEEDSVEKV